VQLNVSYNFKRLALKNDFYIRQYMIENGMNLTKEDEDHSVSTSLEIHQIHNVIRTSNCYRPQPAISSVTELRRNSTTSSVSGVSLLVNGCETNGVATNGSTNDNRFAHPTRPFVRPIQIKTEPVDDGYEDTTTTNNAANVNGTQSSPSNSSNGSVSVLTVASSEKSVRQRPKTPPMIVINGHISSEQKTPKTAMKKVNSPPTSPPKRVRIMEKKEPEKSRDAVRNLRTIRKPTDQAQAKRKIRKAAEKMIELQKKTQQEAKQKKLKRNTKKAKVVQQQGNKKNNSNNSNVQVRKQGRPRKDQCQQPQKSFKGKGGHKRT
jgi:hypothetical protein